MRVSACDISRFSTALGELYAEADLSAFPMRLLSALQVLVAAEVHIYNEFGPDRFVAIEIPNVFTPALTEAFVAHMHESPLVTAAMGPAPMEPGRISDFLSDREWRERGVYKEAFGPLGLGYQIGQTTETDRVVTTYSMCRTGKDFSEEECALLSLLTPHIRNARQGAVTLSRVNELEKRLAAERERAAVVRFNADGHVLWATRMGRSLLELHFPGVSPDRIAPALLGWALAEAIRFPAHDEISAPPAPRCFEGPSRSLEVRLRPANDPQTFEIQMVERSTSSPESLADFGLTRREAEVLHWITQGKRNSEIGIILGITSKTVNKHAERIFGKLGVETRGAAANMVLANPNVSGRPLC